MTSEKPIQYFSKEYLDEAKKLSPAQIAEYLDDFRVIAAGRQVKKSKLISMKVPEDLLQAFKTKATLQKRPYQTVIKELMRQWLLH